MTDNLIDPIFTPNGFDTANNNPVCRSNKVLYKTDSGLSVEQVLDNKQDDLGTPSIDEQVLAGRTDGTKFWKTLPQDLSAEDIRDLLDTLGTNNGLKTSSLQTRGSTIIDDDYTVNVNNLNGMIRISGDADVIFPYNFAHMGDKIWILNDSLTDSNVYVKDDENNNILLLTIPARINDKKIYCANFTRGHGFNQWTYTFQNFRNVVDANITDYTLEITRQDGSIHTVPMPSNVVQDVEMDQHVLRFTKANGTVTELVNSPIFKTVDNLGEGGHGTISLSNFDSTYFEFHADIIDNPNIVIPAINDLGDNSFCILDFSKSSKKTTITINTNHAFFKLTGTDTLTIPPMSSVIMTGHLDNPSQPISDSNPLYLFTSIIDTAPKTSTTDIIYFNSISGNDDFDGQFESRSVQTLSRLYSLSASHSTNYGVHKNNFASSYTDTNGYVSRSGYDLEAPRTTVHKLDTHPSNGYYFDIGHVNGDIIVGLNNNIHVRKSGNSSEIVIKTGSHERTKIVIDKASGGTTPISIESGATGNVHIEILESNFPSDYSLTIPTGLNITGFITLTDGKRITFGKTYKIGTDGTIWDWTFDENGNLVTTSI